MSLIIKRPVVIQHVVTAEFKSQLTNEIEEAINQIDLWLEQEEFQSRRLITEAEKEGKEFVSSLRQEIEAERGKQTQVRQNLLARLQEVKQLEIDSFFVSGTYDAPIKIEVGDNIRTKLSQVQVIVKDGIVIQVIE